MRERFSFAFLTTVLGISVSLTACIDAQPLPLEPYEAGVELSTHVEDWRDEVIYQVITDRFHDGDVNNNYNVDKRVMSRYHGGDWQGIIDKLDYIQALGVTTLWISPTVKNVEEDAGFASYHGYWTQDFLKHNPHFGDLATLRRLSDALHARGMKLILDVVTNHVGQVFFYDINMNGQADEWLTGGGWDSYGLGREILTCTGEGAARECIVSALSRVTEYDPEWRPEGIKAYTSMGIAGPAPIIFFDDPAINRVAPGPTHIDLDGNGKIEGLSEVLGFSNPDWYHQKGRIFDYDLQPGKSAPYQHRFTLADGSPGPYIDGVARDYYQNDQTLLGDFPGGLKDIATERDDVRQAMVAMFSYWIDVTDCDGFRIDTLKHVEYSFWETFAPAIREHAKRRGKDNFLMFGEAFDGNDKLLAAYTGPNQVDSVFLFSQKYAIDQVFKCPPGNTAPYCVDPETGVRQVNGSSALYAWPDDIASGGRHQLYSHLPQVNGVVDAQGKGVAPRDLLVNFLDNHDVARFLFDRNDDKGVDALKNALSFLMFQRGIPCLYYGTEQGFFGGNDPANREDMWDPLASIFAHKSQLAYHYEPWNTDNPIFHHIQKLIKIRKAVPALRRGVVSENVWHSDRTQGPDAGIYAFSRSYEGKSALIVVNTHERDSQRTQGDIGDGLIETPWVSTQVVDILNTDNYRVSVSGSKALVTVPPMTTRVLVPLDDLSFYGL